MSDAFIPQTGFLTGEATNPQWMVAAYKYVDAIGGYAALVMYKGLYDQFTFSYVSDGRLLPDDLSSRLGDDGVQVLQDQLSGLNERGDRNPDHLIIHDHAGAQFHAENRFSAFEKSKADLLIKSLQKKLDEHAGLISLDPSICIQRRDNGEPFVHVERTSDIIARGGMSSDADGFDTGKFKQFLERACVIAQRLSNLGEEPVIREVLSTPGGPVVLKSEKFETVREKCNKIVARMQEYDFDCRILPLKMKLSEFYDLTQEPDGNLSYSLCPQTATVTSNFRQGYLTADAIEQKLSEMSRIVQEIRDLGGEPTVARHIIRYHFCDDDALSVLDFERKVQARLDGIAEKEEALGDMGFTRDVLLDMVRFARIDRYSDAVSIQPDGNYMRLTSADDDVGRIKLNGDEFDVLCHAYGRLNNVLGTHFFSKMREPLSMLFNAFNCYTGRNDPTLNKAFAAVGNADGLSSIAALSGLGNAFPYLSGFLGLVPFDGRRAHDAPSVDDHTPSEP
ncbi:MAG: hypothetical protein ACPGRX_05605 [Bdellovibrionales bacterium]